MSSIKVLGAAAMAAFGLFLTGCNQDGATTAKSPRTVSPVIVNVNNEPITVDDFRAETAGLPPEAMDVLADDEARTKFLDNLVAKKLIIQDALKRGMDKDPDVVQKLDQIRDNMVLGMYVQKEVVEKASVTDEAVKKYFDEHKADLGSVRISHIQVPTQEEAKETIVKFKAGESFKDLARKYSEDTRTKDKEGDLGFLGWADFGAADLREAAFTTPLGDVSNVVRSSFAFHVIKVTDKKPATDEEFPAIKAQLKDFLIEKSKEDMFEARVKELKDKAAIKMSDTLDQDLAFLKEGEAAEAPKKDAK